GQTGAVIKISRSKTAPGKRGVSANIQGVALIVVEGAEIGNRKIRQPAGDRASGLGNLIRVCEVNLCAMSNLRRTQRYLPSVDLGAFDGEWEEKIRFPNHVVIEKVVRAGVEGVGIDDPPMIRNHDAELMFFVALAMERDESAIALGAQVEQRARRSHQRRSLI